MARSSRPDASWRDPDSVSHIRGVAPLRQHPDSRRGSPGSMPLGQPRRLLGAFAGVPQTTDSSGLGEAAGGSSQAAAAAGGYSATGGGGDSGAAAFAATAPMGSGSATSGQGVGAFAPAGGSQPGVTTTTDSSGNAAYTQANTPANASIGNLILQNVPGQNQGYNVNQHQGIVNSAVPSVMTGNLPV